MHKPILFSAAFALVAAGHALGQAGVGTISGTITDSTKAVIPNAIVTLTNPSIGLRRQQTTDNSGNFRFGGLTVAAGYSVSFAAQGFQPTTVTNVSTTVGETITENVSLSIGNTEKIEVSAIGNEQVQTQTSALSQVIDQKVWQDSPLEFRSQNTFVGLTAGAATDSGGTGRGYAVNGSRTGTGNFLVEGMDNNDQGQGGAGKTYGTGGAVTTISPDAIQEYRVISHNPSAEYGRAGGFSTDTVMKSGTNQFHGSLFEYNRIQALAANDFVSTANGVKDSLIRNQFGGSVGGPIYKDKTFFFASVEIHHLRQGTPLQGTVTTQQFLNFVDSGAFEKFQESDPNGLCMQTPANGGIGAACPGAFNKAATLGPKFKQLLAAEPTAFPLGTLQTTVIGQGLYTAGINYPVPVYATVAKIQKEALNQERATMKIDHHLSAKDELSFTYLLDLERDNVPLAGGGTTFGPDEVQFGGSQLFTGNWTHTFTPTLQNVGRLGYTRHVSNFNAPNTAGVPMTVTYADPLAAGFGAYSGFPQLFTDNEFLYEDAITKVMKKHTFKAGFRFVRTRNGSSFYNDNSGTLYPWDVESLLTDETFDGQADLAIAGGYQFGSLAEASASIDTTNNQAPDPYRGYRAKEFAAYFQDDYKVTNRLVFNLGVRWEYFGPPHNFKPGLDSNVYFGTFGTPTPNGNPFLPNAPIVGAIQGATFIQKNSDIWNKDTNNFGPRVGFSYDALGNGKLAIRGGFGIGFDRLYNNAYENIRFNSPHFADNAFGYEANGVVADGALQPALLNLPFNANASFSSYGAKPVPRHVDQRLVTAYYEQASFGGEYEIAPGYVAEVNYVGTFGRKLLGLTDVNNFDGRTACATLTAACTAAGFKVANKAQARPNVTFNADNFRTNGFSSNYNGIQASLRKSFSGGLMLLANYTYSKAMDQVSDVFTQKTGGTGPTDVENPGLDYGPSDFDTRHIGTITANYEVPYKKRNLLLGGFGISPILKLQSGSPFTVTDSLGTYDPNKDGRLNDRAVYIGGGSLTSAVHRSGNPYRDGQLNANSFAPYVCPANVNLGLWCNPPANRNQFYGPHFTDLDLAVSKRFYVTEAQHFTLQASFFDLFNHPNFVNPISDINNPFQFGKSQATQGDEGGHRVTQLALRYDF